MNINVSWHNALVELLPHMFFMTVFWIYSENTFSLVHSTLSLVQSQTCE